MNVHQLMKDDVAQQWCFTIALVAHIESSCSMLSHNKHRTEHTFVLGESRRIQLWLHRAPIHWVFIQTSFMAPASVFLCVASVEPKAWNWSWRVKNALLEITRQRSIESVRYRWALVDGNQFIIRLTPLFLGACEWESYQKTLCKDALQNAPSFNGSHCWVRFKRERERDRGEV